MVAADVVELLRQVIRIPPRSMREAQELEGRLLRVHGALPEVEDFLEALALYQPTDGPDAHLVGYEGIRSAARAALHDLGQHADCLHDVPLMDRP